EERSVCPLSSICGHMPHEMWCLFPSCSTSWLSESSDTSVPLPPGSTVGSGLKNKEKLEPTTGVFCS
ncbi:mCG142574, partial [Mus musculus]